MSEQAIEIGSKWVLQKDAEDPWPRKAIFVKILDTREGWVRYYMNVGFPDNRMSEKLFRATYERVPE